MAKQSSVLKLTMLLLKSQSLANKDMHYPCRQENKPLIRVNQCPEFSLEKYKSTTGQLGPMMIRSLTKKAELSALEYLPTSFKEQLQRY